MLCRRIIAVALTLSFLLALSAPVAALSRDWKKNSVGHHPWQDDIQNGGEVVADRIIRVPLGPITIKIVIKASEPGLNGKFDSKKPANTSKPKSPQTQKGQ